jgi:molecular chaperone HtpG
MQQVKDYTHKHEDKDKTFKFVNLSKDGNHLDETDDEKKQKEEDEKKYEGLCKAIKETLSDKVEKVKVSNKLSETPCVLSTGEYGWSAYMEQIMKSQALRDNSMASYMKSKKIMEINPKHKIIKKLLEMSSDVNKQFKDLVHLLYDSSLLISGFTLDDPKSFTNRINTMISLGLSLDEEKEVTLPQELPTVSEKVETVMEAVD